MSALAEVGTFLLILAAVFVVAHALAGRITTGHWPRYDRWHKRHAERDRLVDLIQRGHLTADQACDAYERYLGGLNVMGSGAYIDAFYDAHWWRICAERGWTYQPNWRRAS